MKRSHIATQVQNRQGMTITWIRENDDYKEFQVSVGTKLFDLDPMEHRRLINNLLGLYYHSWRRGEPNPIPPTGKYTMCDLVNTKSFRGNRDLVFIGLDFTNTIDCLTIFINNFAFYDLIKDKLIAFEERESLEANKVYIGHKELRKITGSYNTSEINRFKVNIWDLIVEFVPTEESVLLVTRTTEHQSK